MGNSSSFDSYINELKEKINLETNDEIEIDLDKVKTAKQFDQMLETFGNICVSEDHKKALEIREMLGEVKYKYYMNEREWGNRYCISFKV